MLCILSCSKGGARVGLRKRSNYKLKGISWGRLMERAVRISCWRYLRSGWQKPNQNQRIRANLHAALVSLQSDKQSYSKVQESVKSHSPHKTTLQSNPTNLPLSIPLNHSKSHFTCKSYPPPIDKATSASPKTSLKSFNCFTSTALTLDSSRAWLILQLCLLWLQVSSIRLGFCVICFCAVTFSGKWSLLSPISSTISAAFLTNSSCLLILTFTIV